MPRSRKRPKRGCCSTTGTFTFPAAAGTRTRNGSLPTICAGTPKTCTTTTISPSNSIRSSMDETASCSTWSPVSGALDAAVTDERRDINWNPVWDYKGSRSRAAGSPKWPFPSSHCDMDQVASRPGTFQLRRMMRSKNERAYLTRIPAAWGSGGINHPSAAAILVGLEVPAPAWNLEVKPYAISGITTDLLVRPTVRNHVKPEAGVDLKYGVTKSLSADFTYNTDFAQVEADDAQVNLTRFSLLFPEKRDFFLESAGVFEFGNVGSTGRNRGDAPTIFYSRRIGLSETGAVPVVGGGRLAGKIGLWSVGALNIQVGDDATVGAVKPNFSVVRLRRNILRRSTSAGFTHADRSRPSRQAATMCGGSTATSRSTRTSTWAATWRNREPRAGPVTTWLTARNSTIRPIGTVSRWIGWSSSRTSTRRWVCCGGRTSGGTTCRRVSAHARRTAGGAEMDLPG